MKAIRLRARGGPESLAFEDAPTPCPGPSEVLSAGFHVTAKQTVCLIQQ